MTAQEATKAFDELKAQGYSEDDIIGVLYLMFIDDKLDINQLEELVGGLGYELSPEFKAMSPEDQKTKGWEPAPDKNGESKAEAQDQAEAKGGELVDNNKEFEKKDDKPEEAKEDSGAKEDSKPEESDDEKAKKLFGF